MKYRGGAERSDGTWTNTQGSSFGFGTEPPTIQEFCPVDLTSTAIARLADFTKATTSVFLALPSLAHLYVGVLQRQNTHLPG